MISAPHQRLLADAAIDLAVAEDANVRSILRPEDLPEEFRGWQPVPGLLFEFQPLDGEPVVQYRPDQPLSDANGRPLKYVFPKGVGSVLTIHPRMRPLVGRTQKVLIVEGTKQYLAAVSAAPNDTLVVGIPGCWGWSEEGHPVAAIQAVTPQGGTVVVAFDADVTTNPNVHDAAERLSRNLKAFGAGSVLFVQLPASGKSGLDDYLASVTDRPQVLRRLIEQAKPLGRHRPKTSSNQFLSGNTLKFKAAMAEFQKRVPLAVDRTGRLLAYRQGVYRLDPHLIDATLFDMLGDGWSSRRADEFKRFATSQLVTAGQVADGMPHGLLNLRNGLLRLDSGVLEEHSPDVRCTTQLPINWNPSAQCPTFDAWLHHTIGAVASELLEDSSTMLDPHLAQRKALFLHGPARSGKSTFMRVLEALVGDENRSAVTLHDLSNNRFAAADVDGKLLNAAADLSAAHVEDLSIFKMLTGDDPVRAERKHQQPFTFHNTALFVFSANTIPTVAENSNAYLSRIRPYEFARSFEGREDSTLQARLNGEMEGILVRFVEALQSFRARGGYSHSDAVLAEQDKFARASDRVRLFLSELDTEASGERIRRDGLYRRYTEWCFECGHSALGKLKFFERVRSAGVPEVKIAGEIYFRLASSAAQPEPSRQNESSGAIGAEIFNFSSPSVHVTAFDDRRTEKKFENGAPFAPQAPNDTLGDGAPQDTEILIGNYFDAPCDGCGEVTRRHVSAQPLRCRMTPGCRGHHVVPDGVRALFTQLPTQPKQAAPPRRPSKKRLTAAMPGYPGVDDRPSHEA